MRRPRGGPARAGRRTGGGSREPAREPLLRRVREAAAVSTAPAVQARALEKWYGPLPAVHGIDFALRPGEFLTVFGPNGAGKTTLLRLLCGAVKPTRGEVFVAGEPAASEGARRRIGLL